MKNWSKIIFLSLTLFSLISNAQSLTALQQQNARATGYAIVASKNLGKSFSVFLVKWDGIHDLEYNANNQINSTWHPQAVIKGNYFDQAFANNDFTLYSSVLVSQAEFDIYKNTGTDWWIVYSTLPSFSNNNLSISDNGNVGIGAIAATKLDVNGTITVRGSNQTNLEDHGQIFFENPNHGIRRTGNVVDFFTSGGLESGITFTLRSYNPPTDSYTNMNQAMKILSNGNVGIGTTNPTSKLTVAGNINSREVKVTVDAGADFVFDKEYDLPSLTSVEKFINENKHLPEIASAKQMQKDGINLSEMNIKLLQKIEELTLYLIEMKKENQTIKEHQTNLEKRIKNFENK